VPLPYFDHALDHLATARPAVARDTTAQRYAYDSRPVKALPLFARKLDHLVIPAHQMESLVRTEDGVNLLAIKGGLIRGKGTRIIETRYCSAYGLPKLPTREQHELYAF